MAADLSGLRMKKAAIQKILQRNLSAPTRTKLEGQLQSLTAAPTKPASPSKQKVKK